MKLNIWAVMIAAFAWVFTACVSNPAGLTREEASKVVSFSLCFKASAFCHSTLCDRRIYQIEHVLNVFVGIFAHFIRAMGVINGVINSDRIPDHTASRRSAGTVEESSSLRSSFM